MSERFFFRSDPELRDQVLAARLGRVAKALTTADGRPELTDAEAEASLRAWIRCRARRWVGDGWDYELDAPPVESRAELVGRIADAALQRRGSDPVIHQALRLLGDGLRAAVETEVAGVVPLDLVPAWLIRRREEEAAEQAARAGRGGAFQPTPVGP